MSGRRRLAYGREALSVFGIQSVGRSVKRLATPCGSKRQRLRGAGSERLQTAGERPRGRTVRAGPDSQVRGAPDAWRWVARIDRSGVSRLT